MKTTIYYWYLQKSKSLSALSNLYLQLVDNSTDKWLLKLVKVEEETLAEINSKITEIEAHNARH